MRSTLLLGVILLLQQVDFSVAQQANFSCAVRPTQADTSEKLQQLRAHLISHNLTAYVIFSEDEHQSEYVQPSDERRAWITGFLGSAGVAVVTRDRAALWTDGRYWTQAEDELDCRNWYLMRSGQAGVPSLTNWLLTQVNGSSPYNRVGVAAQFVSSSWWSSVNSALQSRAASLVEVTELIDYIWKAPERPSAPANEVFAHDLAYTGMRWEEKVKTIAGLLQARKADAYIVTALDDVAWLFSLRGSDIPYSPFFKAYAIVYANQSSQLWMNVSQLTANASEQLAAVERRPYASFLSDLLRLANESSITKIWISSWASQAILNRIPVSKRLISESPVEFTKVKKNPVEERGMRECGVRDSVARVRHLAWLEDQLNSEVSVNETQAAAKLEQFQSDEDLFQSLSFDSISAFGPNAAIIHYSPKAATAANITKNGLYLLDAGAQYLDCTTDVTRTHVFGTATAEQRMAYTLVLQGSIDLAAAIFPYGTYGRNLDILARKPLFQHFMNYNHGTGHGIGHYLSVHEGPSFISMGYSPSDIPLADGMVFSDEPGFYLPQNFGIRLETGIIVKNYTLPHNYGNSPVQFLRFDLLTFVPFERELIVCEMLTVEQRNWLNEYHRQTRNHLASRLRTSEERAYLQRKTEELHC